MDAFSYLPRRLLTFAQARFDSEDGASLVEYALLIGLIALVALIAVTSFGDALGDKFDDVASSVADA